MDKCDLIIIGAGPAGLSAAEAARRLGIKRILVLERMQKPGGILTQCFHKGFGLAQFGEELTGVEYAERLLAEIGAETEIRTGSFVTELSPGGVVSVADGGGVYRVKAGAVILATGCRERPVGSLPVFGARPAGVFTAGSVQRMLNLCGYEIGNRAVVLGSGDVGMIVSHHLSERGTQVLAVIEIDNKIGGLPRNRTRYLEPHGIPVFTGKTITRLHGAKRLEAVIVCNVDENKKPIPESGYRLACDTLVTSVGLIPELELVRGLDVKLKNGRLAGENVVTDVPWLFVCGNARRVQSLIDSVTAEGNRAGTAAAEYLGRAES